MSNTRSEVAHDCVRKTTYEKPLLQTSTCTQKTTPAEEVSSLFPSPDDRNPNPTGNCAPSLARLAISGRRPLILVTAMATTFKVSQCLMRHFSYRLLFPPCF